MLGHILWVEGIIGAGKTTLAKKLAEDLNFELFLEPVDSNPYLSRFYQDPKRWAFPMQIYLLARRYAIQQTASYISLVDSYKGAVLDRGIAGDRVFCRLHAESGNMADIEWQTYDYFYNVMAANLRVPSLVLFLDVEPEIALKRIRGRNRDAEKNIDLVYLEQLRAGYLDLLVDIESGRHAWAQGMSTLRWPWNLDNQSITPLLQELGVKFGMSLLQNIEGTDTRFSSR